MLEAAGGSNIFGAVRRESVQPSTEDVLAAAPDVIIEVRGGGAIAPGQVDSERNVWQILPGIPAVRGGRVYMLIGDELVVPGPRIGEATEKLARVLHPEAF